jgi:hypothetical protein
MAHDVFISYSSRDHKIADAVCKALEKDGTKCWIAPRDIIGGTYSAAIVRAINSSKIMILILSSNANQSPQVAREVERAVSGGKIIYPFRIEPVKPSEDLELFISAQHWLDAFPPPIEPHLDRLVKNVKHQLGAPDASPYAPAATPPDDPQKRLVRPLVEAAPFTLLCMWLFCLGAGLRHYYIHLILLFSILLFTVNFLRNNKHLQVGLGDYAQRLSRDPGSRRAFLWSAGAGAMFGLGYLLSPRRFMPGFLRSPRFESRKPRPRQPFEAGLQNTFQLNKNSMVVHYIKENGFTSDRAYLEPANLESIDAKRLIAAITEKIPSGPVESREENPRPKVSPIANSRRVTQASRREEMNAAPQGAPDGRQLPPKRPRFPLSQAGALSESLAIQQANSNDISLALRILWDGIEKDTSFKVRIRRPPSYRLYDLATKLAARSPNAADELLKLLKYVQDTWKDDQKLIQRSQKWNNLSGR